MLTFQSGDIIACFGTDLTSLGISTVTGSPFAPQGLRWGPSHVAIIANWQRQSLWIESTTLCRHPCLIRREPVAGPQAHLPETRVADYLDAGGRVDVYRPTPVNRFSADEHALLAQLLINEFVRSTIPYDLTGAILSGTRLFQWSHLFPAADLHSLFCSELVAAMLMRLSRLNRDNPTRFHPGRLLRELVRTGTYQRIHSLT